MKLYELYIFTTLAGTIGYIFYSVPGFLVGALWALLVSLILALFSHSN